MSELKTYYKSLRGSPKSVNYFTPLQLAQIYNFPAGDGTGQKIGIIELGGGYSSADIQTYFNKLGISEELQNNSPNLVDVSVDSATNNPNDGSGANDEVVLDIEIIAAIVPKAEIRIYFAPNSFSSFYTAIQRAINDNCGIVSISWGATEKYWSTTYKANYNSLFGSASNRMVVTVASGDAGSSDGSTGNNCDFPSSSPNVLACGGTTLTANLAKTTRNTEVVWNNNPTTSATGGGVSNFFAKPSYQSGIVSITKRGVPDISGDADPYTGYLCYSEGSDFVVGGTSAVAPLWAGLIARINQNLGRNLSCNELHSVLYTQSGLCYDVTQGNNGSFNAGLKWDACTGMGTPNGVSILNYFKSLVVPSQPNPQPQPEPNPQPVLNPTANFTFTAFHKIVRFKNTSTNSTSWLWNFGDSTKTTNVKNPTHIYRTPGNYTVTLTAKNGNLVNTITKLVIVKK